MHRQIISVDSLLLDHNNARHGDLEDQRAILKWMSEGAVRQKDLKLASDIAELGLSPIELPLVVPAGEDGMYTVLEGNRRVCTLKMLLDPGKCPNPTMSRRLAEIAEHAAVPIATELECVVAPDFDAADPWILRRHNGEDEGRGLVPWGTRERANYDKRRGGQRRYPGAQDLVDVAVARNLIEDEDALKIPISTLHRLVANADVKRLMGIEYQDGQLKRVADPEYVDRAVRSVLTQLRDGVLNSRVLHSADDRKDRIRELRDEEAWGEYTARDPVPLDADNGDQNDQETSGGTRQGKRGPSDPLNRSHPIPTTVSMRIENGRLKQIYRELRALKSHDHRNAASVLTRVFVELMLDEYIDRHADVRVRRDSTLRNKATHVRTHLVRQHPDDEERIQQQLRGLEVFASDENMIGSCRTLNDVVHNAHFSMNARDVNHAWEQLLPCLPWFEGHV